MLCFGAASLRAPVHSFTLEQSKPTTYCVEERKVSNVVLEILGHITPENYDAVKAELIGLLFMRHLTDEEITTVGHMMYDKAVRPEEVPDSEMNLRLIADLVRDMNGHTTESRTLRRAIIDKSQNNFDGPFVWPVGDRVDAKGNPLPVDLDTQIIKVTSFERNIKLLGHLFVRGVVKESVVNLVLSTLVFGKEDNAEGAEHRPVGYEIELFGELMMIVGKKLSVKTQHEYIPAYMTALRMSVRWDTPKLLTIKIERLVDLWRADWGRDTSSA